MTHSGLEPIKDGAKPFLSVLTQDSGLIRAIRVVAGSVFFLDRAGSNARAPSRALLPPAQWHFACCIQDMKEREDNDLFDALPAIKGYPRPEEPELEDLPAEWTEEDRISAGRMPDLGEIEKDPSET